MVSTVLMKSMLCSVCKSYVKRVVLSFVRAYSTRHPLASKNVQ
jgi:hypothetical protein